MEEVCHYTLLGIPTDASNATIRQAYAQAIGQLQRRLASADPPPVSHFDALRAAYQTLVEPQQRARYDQARGITPPTPPDSPSPPVMANAIATTEATVNPHMTGCPVEFHGEGKAYFRIWLVNLALTLCTLGIYSAWAKVRREQYFHRNLIVDGAAFDYHGSPKAILLGRIIMLVLLVGLQIPVEGNPLLAFAILGLFVFGFPWLMLSSLRFRARNTSWRGIRFDFTGRYRSALGLYVGGGLLLVLSCGLYLPAFLQRQKAFLINNLAYGRQPWSFSAGVGDFYRAMLLPMLLLPLLIGVPVYLAFGWGARQFSGSAGIFAPFFLFLLAVGVLVATYALIALLILCLRAITIRIVWNHITLGNACLRTTLTARSYLGLALSNGLLILLTLGLFWPIAQIRMARYRTRTLTLFNPMALRAIATNATASPLTVGEAANDTLDLGIAL